MSSSQKTFTDIILNMGSRGDRPCFSYVPDGEILPVETLSYQEVLDRARRFATGLQAHGVQRNDRVAMFAQPTPNYLTTFLGVILAGGVVTPINHHFMAAELSAYLDYIDPRLVIYDAEGQDVVEAVRRQGDYPWRALRIDAEDGAATDSEGQGTEPAFLRWSDWEPVAPYEAAPGDLALILHTSGTTALPKGVERTQRAMRAFIDRWVGFAWREQDTLLSYLPFYHQSGSLAATLPMIAAGGHSIQWQRFSASKFWDVVDHNHATIANVIPPVPTYLLMQPPSERDRDHTLEWVVIGGRTDHWSEFQERFGVVSHSPYGSTETTYVTISGDRDTPGPSPAELMGAVPHFYAGSLIPDYEEIRVMGPEGPVGPGVPGEIQVRGPAVFERYFRLPDVTAEVFDGDWFKTGDIGYLREDGYLFMIDRAKEVIRRASENISPQEIEIALSEHMAVKECVALGVPDPIRGQEILVCVVPEEGQALSPEEVFDYCASRLSAFKVPRYLELWPDLPRTGTMKIRKDELRESNSGVIRHDRLVVAR